MGARHILECNVIFQLSLEWTENKKVLKTIDMLKIYFLSGAGADYLFLGAESIKV